MLELIEGTSPTNNNLFMKKKTSNNNVVFGIVDLDADDYVPDVEGY